MPRKYLFADESGCFTFNRKANVSRYFILTTITSLDCQVGNALIDLRRKLLWEQHELGDAFHATSDKQKVRDQVFTTIAEHDFEVQATIMEKSKAQPQVTKNMPTFYKYGWYYHFKNAVHFHLPSDSQIHIAAEAIGTKKQRATFKASVNEVLQQHMPRNQWVVDFCPPASDPCLQVADYCSWAIQRKWERSDVRSYEIIKDRITYEYDLWSHGTKHYY